MATLPRWLAPLEFRYDPPAKPCSSSAEAIRAVLAGGDMDYRQIMRAAAKQGFREAQIAPQLHRMVESGAVEAFGGRPRRYRLAEPE